MMEDTQKSEALAENKRGTVRKWYHGHSETYNESRRQKYASNLEAREKARERARVYRERRRTGVGQTESPLWRYVNGEGSCEYGQGKRIPVWTTGQIAEDIGCTPQMLRNWERKGWIPASMFPDKHRLYTQNQAGLITLLAAFMSNYRTSPKKYKPELQKLVAIIAEQWMKHNDPKN